MTLVEFIERAPLYQWFEVDINIDKSKGGFRNFVLPYFSAYCEHCKAERSFGNSGVARSGVDANVEYPGRTMVAMCVCIHCHQFWRGYIVHFHKDGKRVMKAGQYPPWDISIDRKLADMLGSYKDIYKKGFICELQGYGIASYAYYRRIVESIIDELLKKIESLLEKNAREKYKEALKAVETTRQTSEKIELVKDLLPDTLKPDGFNPLGVLHGALSEGLHELSEDECLERSTSIRNVLVFLVNQTQQHKEGTKEFTEGMRMLLDKKSSKQPK